MMRRTLIGAAVMFTLLLIASSRPVQAQGLASLAAAASGSSMAVEKTPTCWGCGYYGGPGFPTGLCQAGGSGSNSGLKCESTMAGPCRFSGGACGSSALVPVDPDGTSQYVSRGSRLGLLVVMKDG
ncbi:MAG TPA: hypothetical protein VG817_11585, partial [Gemmatimonadales bacterium]|nr:hypothetical protein [Gemmatimonadales bacterium]